MRADETPAPFNSNHFFGFSLALSNPFSDSYDPQQYNYTVFQPFYNILYRTFSAIFRQCRLFSDISDLFQSNTDFRFQFSLVQLWIIVCFVFHFIQTPICKITGGRSWIRAASGDNRSISHEYLLSCLSWTSLNLPIFSLFFSYWIFLFLSRAWSYKEVIKSWLYQPYFCWQLSKLSSVFSIYTENFIYLLYYEWKQFELFFTLPFYLLNLFSRVLNPSQL